jgi:transcriptional regulator with XRE-family HTH domain
MNLMQTKQLIDQQQQHYQRHLELCTFLRELRLSSGYTQAEVSEGVKLSRTTISKIERMGNFTLLNLYELADFYEIPINQLFQEII